MRFVRVHRLTTAAGLIALVAVPAAGRQVMGLGIPPGSGNSYARAISADGSTVVGGYWSGSAHRAFRWTAAGGMEDLGVLPPVYGQETVAYGADAGGTFVVGTSEMKAFRWTPGAGMQPLGAYNALGVSADGGVIVGQFVPEPQVYRAGRLAGGGWTNLGILAGYIDSGATSVSADGAVVAGYCWGMFSSRAFRWTEATGMQNLGTLPGYARSDRSIISADGTTIAGTCSNDPPASFWSTRGFRWTGAGGMQPLPVLLPAHTWTSATAVSADGTIVAGSSGSEFGSSGVVWTPQGALPLADWLGARGVSTTGWSLLRVTGFSADGLRLAGEGFRIVGPGPEAVLITLPPACYPDCNVDAQLTVADFGCFQTKFVAADPYADCNGDGQRTVADFGCFQTKFVAGCP